MHSRILAALAVSLALTGCGGGDVPETPQRGCVYVEGQPVDWCYRDPYELPGAPERPTASK